MNLALLVPCFIDVQELYVCYNDTKGFCLLAYPQSPLLLMSSIAVNFF